MPAKTAPRLSIIWLNPLVVASIIGRRFSIARSRGSSECCACCVPPQLTSSKDGIEINSAPHSDTIRLTGHEKSMLENSVYLAYETLSEPIKKLIDGMTAIHDGEHAR